FMAVVVRLNRSGPEKVQRAISLAAAGYCALTMIVMTPLTAVPGGGFFPMLGMSMAMLWLVTR
ncbi:MAG TPA: hypothetical protein VFY14_07385, partial [Streptomyces sp.]|nr:hypothetical protein [Streptomyces sp.]